MTEESQREGTSVNKGKQYLRLGKRYEKEGGTEERRFLQVKVARGEEQTLCIGKCRYPHRETRSVHEQEKKGGAKEGEKREL